MKPSYYRLKEDLRTLIDATIDRPIDQTQARGILEILQGVMLELDANKATDLYEMALYFRHWIDDLDIRQRDEQYDQVTTARLKSWSVANR